MGTAGPLDEGAEALVGADKTRLPQRPQRLTHSLPANAEAGDERRLRRQLGADRKDAADDLHIVARG